MQEISKHLMVTVTYDLRLDDEQGEIIEQTTKENPLQFLYGAGMMLPKFESSLAGLKQGDPFTIRLSKKEAYGEVNNDAIVELPKHLFLVNGEFDDELISEGNSVPMMSSNGQRLNGIVLAVDEENVKMDFNHPLAGEDLFFTGTVIEIREPSEEELAQVLNKGGCNCGSEGCDDSNCDSDNEGGCGCGC